MDIVEALRTEEIKLVQQLETVRKAIQVFDNGNHSANGNHSTPKRTMSAKGRAAIAAAQKKRWAKLRSGRTGKVRKGQ
jgi:hypothetical protein